MQNLNRRKLWLVFTATLILVGFSILVFSTSAVGQNRPLILPTPFLQSALSNRDWLRDDNQEWRYACTHNDVQAVYDYFNPTEQRVPPFRVNYEALDLPSPAYPKLARAAGVTGSVSVDIVVDETGRVIYSRSFSGPILLSATAEKVACQALFTPPTASGAAVKVRGTINYNFTLE